MNVTVDLARLVGAEYTSLNGVPGVFIPLVPNVVHKIDAGGRHAYATFTIWPTPAKASYDFSGIQRIPSEYFDKYLESPQYAGNRARCIWGRNNRPKGEGGPVSKDFLERIIGDE